MVIHIVNYTAYWEASLSAASTSTAILRSLAEERAMSLSQGCVLTEMEVDTAYDLYLTEQCRAEFEAMESPGRCDSDLDSVASCAPRALPCFDIRSYVNWITLFVMWLRFDVMSMVKNYLGVFRAFAHANR